jgi:peptidoglycan/LPS O-acetylase OafA/YrhL
MHLMAPGFFRFFLALSVVVYHMSRFAIGRTAVYVFFVLSGYWITLMWKRKYAATGSPYVVYLISRLWRLLPVFWLCELLSFGLAPWVQHRTPSSLHFWFSQVAILGYNGLPFRPNGPAWSLDVELQFYLLAPFLIWRMASSLLIVIAAVSLVASFYFGLGLLSCAIFFAIGIYAAKIQWRPGVVVMAGCGTAIAVLIGTCLAVPHLNSLILVGAHPGPLSKWNDELQVAIALFAIPFAIYTTGNKSGRIDRILADASYTLYLVHWPLLQWANTHRIINRETDLCAVFLSCILSSVVLTMYFDGPIQKIRQRWLNAQKLAADSHLTPSTHQDEQIAGGIERSLDRAQHDVLR